jgi:hypothetical protein
MAPPVRPSRTTRAVAPHRRAPSRAAGSIEPTRAYAQRSGHTARRHQSRDRSAINPWMDIPRAQIHPWPGSHRPHRRWQPPAATVPSHPHPEPQSPHEPTPSHPTRTGLHRGPPPGGHHRPPGPAQSPPPTFEQPAHGARSSVSSRAREELAVSTPTVIELPRTLEPTTTDPFIGGIPARFVSASWISAPSQPRLRLSDHPFPPDRLPAVAIS